VQKKSGANKPQSRNVLTVDDFDLIIAAILQQNKEKQKTMYDRIEVDLKGV
jgi:hypothetical protein